MDRPDASRGPAVKNSTRRAFLSRVTVGLTGAIAAIVGLPILGYLLAPLFQVPSDDLVKVGLVTDFPLGKTKLVSIRDPSPLPWAGQTAETALSERVELEGTVLAVLRHPVPRALERPVGWFYVFGAATLAIFIVQIATGVALAMTYVPAPNSAYDSLQFISHEATLGSLIRGIHYFGAGAMVVLVLVHMTQVYLFGAFKFPREVNWLSGSLLLLCTLAMAFTGQLLRWD